jgi:branched-chain amino acid transport system ATP-binding protein
VREGEIVTLLGANGAGKTTTLPLDQRPHPAASGRDPLRRTRHHRASAHEIVKHGIAQSPEGRRLFPG